MKTIFASIMLALFLVGFASGISEINLKSDMDIPSDNLVKLNNGEEVRISMSNGAYTDIKIMPAEASARALAVMEAKCEERNCTVELKERKSGDNARVVYEVEAHKDSKLFGFIKKDMKVKADVDVETGEVINVNKPWWAGLAAEGRNE